jgi:hypothetical protein
MNVISQLASASAKLNSIGKNHKHRGFHEKDHFILMTIELCGTLKCDMNHFIKERVYIFHDRQSRNHLSFFFAFRILGSMLALPFNMF